MSTTEFQVTGMSCGHCEKAITDEVSQIDGVTDITVSAADGTLVVTASAPVDDAVIIAAVDEAGYEAARV